MSQVDFCAASTILFSSKLVSLSPSLCMCVLFVFGALVVIIARFQNATEKDVCVVCALCRVHGFPVSVCLMQFRVTKASHFSPLNKQEGRGVRWW